MMKISANNPLCLGSRSPRRRELLSGLGLPLIIEPADVEESVLDGERPLIYLERVVEDKLVALCRKRPQANGVAAVLVADTIVVIDEEILGKPLDVADAARLLRRLAGRDHVVYTRFAIATGQGEPATVLRRTVSTRVRLRQATDDEIERYAATREGLDKAGAYAAQGIGSYLIERIDGSYTNVVGLPLCEVVTELQHLQLLAEFP
jgi:nucleoside triphosphate pyrophosphatase